jgi:hypothetical protein
MYVRNQMTDILMKNFLDSIVKKEHICKALSLQSKRRGKGAIIWHFNNATSTARFHSIEKLGQSDGMSEIAKILIDVDINHQLVLGVEMFDTQSNSFHYKFVLYDMDTFYFTASK